MHRGFFIISLSGESVGPGFLRMIPTTMIFRIGLGLPGKEQNRVKARMSLINAGNRSAHPLGGACSDEIIQHIRNKDFLGIIDSSGITCQSPENHQHTPHKIKCLLKLILSLTFLAWRLIILP